MTSFRERIGYVKEGNTSKLMFFSNVLIISCLLAILVLLWVGYKKTLDSTDPGSTVPDSAMILAIIGSIALGLFLIPTNLITSEYPMYLVTAVTSGFIFLYSFIFYFTEIDKEEFEDWKGIYIAAIAISGVALGLSLLWWRISANPEGWGMSIIRGRARFQDLPHSCYLKLEELKNISNDTKSTAKTRLEAERDYITLGRQLINLGKLKLLYNNTLKINEESKRKDAMGNLESNKLLDRIPSTLKDKFLQNLNATDHSHLSGGTYAEIFGNPTSGGSDISLINKYRTVETEYNAKKSEYDNLSKKSKDKQAELEDDLTKLRQEALTNKSAATAATTQSKTPVVTFLNPKGRPFVPAAPGTSKPWVKTKATNLPGTPKEYPLDQFYSPQELQVSPGKYDARDIGDTTFLVHNNRVYEPSERIDPITKKPLYQLSHATINDLQKKSKKKQKKSNLQSVS